MYKTLLYTHNAVTSSLRDGYHFMRIRLICSHIPRNVNYELLVSLNFRELLNRNVKKVSFRLPVKVY